MRYAALSVLNGLWLRSRGKLSLRSLAPGYLMSRLRP